MQGHSLPAPWNLWFSTQFLPNPGGAGRAIQAAAIAWAWQRVHLRSPSYSKFLALKNSTKMYVQDHKQPALESSFFIFLGRRGCPGHAQGTLPGLRGSLCGEQGLPRSGGDGSQQFQKVLQSPLSAATCGGLGGTSLIKREMLPGHEEPLLPYPLSLLVYPLLRPVNRWHNPLCSILSPFSSWAATLTVMKDCANFHYIMRPEAHTWIAQVYQFSIRNI